MDRILTRMSPLAGFGILLPVLVLLPDYAPHAQSEKMAAPGRVIVEYGASFQGVPVGDAHIESAIEKGKYRLKANGGVGGLARLVYDGRGSVNARGAIRNNRVRPAAYDQAINASGDRISVNMRFKGDRIIRAKVKPAQSQRKDRIPVTDEHKMGVLDPLSAYFLPIAEKTPNAICNRTIPIYDGKERFDVSLRYQTSRRWKIDGRHLDIVVCTADYHPIAGHRPSNKNSRFYRSNRNKEVWFARVPGLNVAIPVRIKIGTPYGVGSLHARRIRMQ